MRTGSLVRRSIVPVAAGLTLAVLGGCSGGQGPDPDSSGSSPTVTASPTQSTGSPAPSPTWSLTAAEQKAFEEASAAVLAYRQTGIDLFSGARTNLNDMDMVATGDLLNRDLSSLQKSLLAGWKAEPGATVVLTWAQPLAASISASPPSVRVRVCIDLRGIQFTLPDGSHQQGTQGQADYTVVKTRRTAPHEWAVSAVTADESSKPC